MFFPSFPQSLHPHSQPTRGTSVAARQQINMPTKPACTSPAAERILATENGKIEATGTTKRLVASLSWLDRLLAPLVLVFMVCCSAYDRIFGLIHCSKIAGTAAGATTGDAIPNAFNTVQFKGVSFRQYFLSRP